MESYTNRELVDTIADAVRDANQVERVMLRGVDNSDFSEDDRNKLRISSRDLKNQVEDLDKSRRIMLRLVRHHRSDQVHKLEDMLTATKEAKDLFRGMSIAARARESSSDSSSSGSSSGAAPSWGSRGHYSRFVPRSATRVASGKKRTKRKKTKRKRSGKKRARTKHSKRKVTRRR